VAAAVRRPLQAIQENQAALQIIFCIRMPESLSRFPPADGIANARE
jgi:hypothetical protein